MPAQSACLSGANRLRRALRSLSPAAALGCLLALAAAGGCRHDRVVYEDGLAAHVLPPPGVAAAPAGDAAGPPEMTPSRLPEAAKANPPAPTGDAAPPATLTADGAACQAMSLSEAIATAFRLQPRLRVYLEGVEQARGGQQTAFAPFLPSAGVGYHVGGFNLNAGGEGLPVSGSPLPVAFLPPSGVVPIPLNIDSSYELAELRLQWILADFGRRLGRYRQAEIAVDVAQLQTERAYQTTADEVATAYYQVLRTAALRRIAEEAVRRAEDDLELARKLQKGDVILRENVLRNEVELAKARHELDAAEAAAGVAGSALNLAIGLNVSAPPAVADVARAPGLDRSLADCLQTAVDRRRELRVARAGVEAAQEGVRAARADFAPLVVAEGNVTDFQQASPRDHADIALAKISLAWGLFEGGKRVGELRAAAAKVGSAAAEAESVADLIAFQVNEAYRLAVAARKGIDQARPAVDQAAEAYRLVRSRYKEGEATPSDVIDADTALVRAQQSYFNSVYDYLTALARLDYAMGTSPTPDSPPADGACTTQCTTTTHQEPGHDRTDLGARDGLTAPDR
ncbi:MAG TPA: TolC family protein [Gemmataceae bacterium]|nr:TolC family protein [Gemmataceae bacterium]